jgi:hypothetical protein
LPATPARPYTGRLMNNFQQIVIALVAVVVTDAP